MRDVWGRSSAPFCCAVIAVTLGFAFAGLPQCAVGETRIGTNFTGARFGLDGNTFIPPDTMGAVGAASVVELINGRFAVYDKVDGSVLASKSIDQFWIDAGVSPVGFAFDPRVAYDAAEDRWLAVAVDNQGQTNNFLVAASTTDDPLDAWRAFAIASDPFDPGNPNEVPKWADFPTLGFDSQRIYVGADMLSVSDRLFQSATVLFIPKMDLLGNEPTIERSSLHEDATNLGKSLQFSVVQDADASVSISLAVPRVGADELISSRVTGTVENPLLSSMTLLPIDQLPGPLPAQQPAIGGDQKRRIHTGTDRFASSVVQQGGRVWAVASISENLRSAVRWFAIDPATQVVLDTGIVSDDELSFYYPSIAVNEFGDVVIGFSGSSANQPVSTYAAVGTFEDGVTQFDAPILLKAGVDDYERLDSRGRNRWGDYSATVVDPDDPRSFWTFQQFVSGDDEWAIQITQILVGQSPPMPGDANGDGVVDRADARLMAMNYGRETGAVFADGDFDGDGAVTMFDAAILHTHLTAASSAAAVPEPGAFAQVCGVLVMLALGRWRRRR